MPDITRLYKGIHEEFEVEVVFAGPEDTSPREAHPFEEFIFVAMGSVILTRDDEPTPATYRAPAFIHLPSDVEHVIDAQEAPTKVVIIHPDRSPEQAEKMK